MQIVLASHNLHKIREFRELLKHLKGLDVLTLLNFPHYTLPEETGSTFEENAVLKAVDAAKHLNLWVMADDSGLVVPALKGAPGVYSARYARKDATDKENRVKLLTQMEHLRDEQRQGYYECVLALASPEGVKKTVSGKVEGEITYSERGVNGFGYDSIFLKYDYDKTFAELPPEVKNKISHRSKAFEKLLPTLENLQGEFNREIGKR